MTVSHQQKANAIRALSMDAVQKANSGHPGMPMGMADVATVLFSEHLKFDASDPDWPDRDRFVLSAGHGSMLLYSLLYLTGYEDMTIDQIKNFRQLGSKTAGHPEFGHAQGIETTTGPLGQGLANAVGMALAERILATRFGGDLVDHYTYVVAGDGCLMEGVSQEAIGLAGHLRLNKLIVLWDDNDISIDGPLNLTESGDQIARFQASGWATDSVDGHDPDAISAALAKAKTNDKPTLIACKTTIGYGAPTKAGTAATHGSPLGEDEIAGTREALGWPHAAFDVPQDILTAWREIGQKNTQDNTRWRDRLAAHENADTFRRAIKGELPSDFSGAMTAYYKKLAEDQPKVATRKASQMALEVINTAVAETIGGSADLTGSNNTKTSTTEAITPNDYSGRFIHYGIREHGMAAAMNGLALHGGVIPYSGTFLVFTDYCRPAIRMSAIMNQRVIYVMTHDSIGLGEDGPTHQPVEHLMSLRAMPNLLVLRPADAMETAECWQIALESSDSPSVIALTRQGLPAVRLDYAAENRSEKGAYELRAADGDAQVTLIATGSEVEIALKARDLLQADNIGTRVVSMPSWELFDRQDQAYRDKTIGNTQAIVAVEAGSTFGWEKYVGADGATIGMTSFGASGPYQDVYEHFGITADAVANAARAQL